MILDYWFECNGTLNYYELGRFVLAQYVGFVSNECTIFYTCFYRYEKEIHSNISRRDIIEIKVVLTATLSEEEVQDRRRRMSAYSFVYSETNDTDNRVTVYNMWPVRKNYSTYFKAQRTRQPAYLIQDVVENYEPQIELWPRFQNEARFCKNLTINARLIKRTQSVVKPKGIMRFEMSSVLYLDIESWKCQQFSTHTLRSTSPRNQNNMQSHFQVSLETILTYSCMGISSISLIISILIHKILSLFKTLPGCNTFNLLISMLIAHILFMAGIGANDVSIVCKCVGIAIHYFWLTSFTFMTIGVIQITYTFTKLSTQPNFVKRTKRPSKWRLIVVGYTISLIFVIPSVIFDLLDNIPITVGYGGDI